VRQLTLTEQARRAQLVNVTIDLIAIHGYASCSLQRIADAAGITKAAVIYHFASKNAVVRSAYEHVIASLTAHMQERIALAASPSDAVDAYVTSLMGYMAAHPSHVRVITESLDGHHDTGIEDSPHSAARWKPLAAMIQAAVDDGGYRSDVDSRTLALMLNGAIDALVAESLTDAAFDLATATTAVLTMLHRTALKQPHG
jgi:AcrR family transcriptional regulator